MRSSLDTCVLIPSFRRNGHFSWFSACNDAIYLVSLRVSKVFRAVVLQQLDRSGWTELYPIHGYNP
jgi:hypothetical protein